MSPGGVIWPQLVNSRNNLYKHDDIIKWKNFRYWPFVQGIHRSPVNSPRKGQWRGALMFSLICARINRRVNNGEAGDLRRHRAHCDVIVMKLVNTTPGGPLVASFTKEANWWLAKHPLVFNGRLANRQSTSLVKEATGSKPLPEPMLTQTHVNI